MAFRLPFTIGCDTEGCVAEATVYATDRGMANERVRELGWRADETLAFSFLDGVSFWEDGVKPPPAVKKDILKVTHLCPKHAALKKEDAS